MNVNINKKTYAFSFVNLSFVKLTHRPLDTEPKSIKEKFSLLGILIMFGGFFPQSPNV